MKGCCPVHYKISHRNAQMEKIFSRDSIGGMRNTLIYVIGLVVIVGGLFYLAQDKSALSSDYKNIEYTVDKKPVQLTNGLSELSIASSSAKIVTRYFGNEIKKDLNGDDREDIAFILTQETGGTGTFYYVAAALNTEDGYVGSDALYLGDRIAPQGMEPGPGSSIIVNYADRKIGEAMTVDPSVGKSLRLLLNENTMQFGEVAEDFAGEANPERMTLTMKTWNWTKTTYESGKVVTPREQLFGIKFLANGTFVAGSDCNSMGGKYSAVNGSITFSDVSSTKMYCANSQEDDFKVVFDQAQKFRFTSKGELIFDLKMDSGTIIFK